MQILRTRARPTPVVTQTKRVESEEEVSAVPARRLRTAHKNTAAARARAASEAKPLIEEQMKLIANAEAEIDAAQERLQAAHEEVERLMRSANMSSHDNGVYVASIAEQFSRQQTYVDPKKFRAKVAAEDFWSCVSVEVGKAKGIMGVKEFMAIADIKESQSLGYKFSIKPSKAKKG